MVEDAFAGLSATAGKWVAVGLLLYAVGLVGDWMVQPEAWRAWEQGVAAVCEEGRDGSCATTGCALPRSPEDKDELAYWIKERNRVRDACAVSLVRQRVLEAALRDSRSPAFVDARRRLSEEREAFAIYQAREERLRLTTLDGREMWERAALGLIDAVIALLAVALLARSGRVAIYALLEAKLLGWRRVSAVFSVIGVGVVALAMCFGGIYVQHKTSVGVDSFAVSRLAWGFCLASMLGAALMFAQPLALLWILSRKELVPRPDPVHPDGECGVGRYVSFLHVWTMIGFAFALVPTILFLRFMSGEQAAIARPYLFVPFAGAVLIAVLLGRLVWNALKIRSLYHEAVAGLGTSRKEVLEKKPASDPTEAFLGQTWWKLPATLGSILFAVWAILQWAGVADQLIMLIR